MKSCIDLKATYGKKFKVCLEESYHAQPAGQRDASDALWLQIIPGRLGHVFPHGGDVLAASTNNRSVTAQRLLALPDVTLWQDSDDGVTVLFHAEQLEAVAALLHLRRRRVLSPQARLAASERLAKYQFRAAVEVTGEIAVCDASNQVDPNTTQAPATQQRAVQEAVLTGA